MARNERRGPRLDQPLERGRSLRPTVDSETAGRVSERVARFLGSWRFLGYMTFVVFSWLLWNIFAPNEFRVDAFPFLFLTLALSLQASYAAPLILLAQNRQADRDRVQFQEDRDRTERLLADSDYLTREIASLRLALGEVVTRDYLRGEIRDLLEELKDLQATDKKDDPKTS
ncbi:unannotated protein [freshwater metagenome]|uniref:Unannotated protein n=1 Tax=freshwater metagenome TaxID=449393 RepID=A0A6J6XLI9_9ZZZZ|nr:DUF1003 domain-containing protein [Actinomycetota bacterium]MSW24010.1 DUF1003 domain-containing protein [Actinomycetota bacterium]MSX29333.1 DUF1003 domain-containing protein [Actinomycetota bacterium]MSX43867.1 DUF1003 domain-containing protein [Actinomycetota bacterium]MSX96805.1 DUF1003 domain-containing protein [Actinomycetota bacterium]